MDYRMYCIFSKESIARMGGNRGKMAAQAGHAFLHAYWDSASRFIIDASRYMASDATTKITLIAETDDDLRKLASKYRKICGNTVVIDAGKTVFKEPTLTCIGIGPISHNKIEDDLKQLRVFI